MKTINEWGGKSKKATILLNKVKNSVQKIAPNADVIFYGSRAKGEGRENSDWDFLILVDQTVNMALTKKIRNKIHGYKV